MAYIDFFAIREDFIMIFDHLFTNTDVQVLETYSVYGQPPRRFHTIQELLDVLPVGLDRHGKGYAAGLSLW